jgi:hypothetical protein
MTEITFRYFSQGKDFGFEPKNRKEYSKKDLKELTIVLNDIKLDSLDQLVLCDLVDQELLTRKGIGSNKDDKDWALHNLEELEKLETIFEFKLKTSGELLKEPEESKK